MLGKCKGEMDILGKFHVRLIEKLPEYRSLTSMKAIQTILLTADSCEKPSLLSLCRDRLRRLEVGRLR